MCSLAKERKEGWKEGNQQKRTATHNNVKGNKDFCDTISVNMLATYKGNRKRHITLETGNFSQAV